MQGDDDTEEREEKRRAGEREIEVQREVGDPTSYLFCGVRAGAREDAVDQLHSTID